MLLAGGYNDASGPLASAELYESPTAAGAIAVEGAAGTQTGTFSDADGNATVTLTASSGVVTQDNAAGTWSWTKTTDDGPASETITITATDVASATATAGFTFTVTNVAPTPVIASATTVDEDTALSFTFTVTDPSAVDEAVGFDRTIDFGDGSSAVTLAPGDVAPFTTTHTFTDPGTYAVTLTATDKDGDVATATRTITVRDVTSPDTYILTGPTGTVVSGSATFVVVASEVCTFTYSLDGGPATPAPLPGPFSVETDPITFTGLTAGSHTFSVVATDTAGNTDPTPATRTWTVDTIAPTFTLPGPITAEATSAAGAVVNYSASASDVGGSGVATSNFTPASGSTFALGTTTVNASATDNAGNTATGTFTVTVVDTTAPVVASHANVTAEATSAAGAAVTYADGSATDAVTASPTITYSKDSGSVFPVGVTTVTITAADAAGNVGTSTFTVTVTGVPGVLSFANGTPSFNPVNSSGLPYLLAVQINRAGAGNGTVSVNVVPSQPATVPIGFAKYVYGTDYEFVSGTASGSTVTFADGVTSATVEVRLKTPALTKKGQFKLTLGTPTGGATSAGTTVALVTINAKDTAKPTVVITTPATTVAAPGTFNLTGTVKDDGATDLSLFTVTLNGATVTPTRGAYVANTAVGFSANGLQAENGTNTLVVTARDAQGNTTVLTKTFTCAGGSLSPALAGTYTGLLVPTGTPDNNTSGFFTATITSTASFTGKVTLGGITVPIKGVLSNEGVAKFTTNASATNLDLIDTVVFNTYLGSLGFAIPPAGGSITATLSTQATAGSTLATATAAKNAFDAAHLVATAHSDLLTVLTGTPKGVYNVGLPSETQPVLIGSQFPQGDGVGILTLSNTGTVTIVGNLADGTAYTASGKLKADLTVPLHVILYKTQGSLAGTLQFDPGAADSDVSGANFLWLRPALPTASDYKAGWPNGVTVSPVGTKFVAPTTGSVLPSLLGMNPTLGNATLDFTDGLLSAAVSKSLNIAQTTTNIVTKLSGDTSYTLQVVNGTGAFSGAFTHSPGKSVAYKGIILNKGGNKGGFGYFLSPPPLSTVGAAQGGSVTLTAKP